MASKSDSVPVTLMWEPPDICRIAIAGRTYVVRPDDRRSTYAIQLARAKSKSAFLQTDNPNVPYKCAGGAIIALQQAGFKRVGFIAEPPPPGYH